MKSFIFILLTLYAFPTFAGEPTPNVSQFVVFVGSSLVNRSSEDSTALSRASTIKGKLNFSYENSLNGGIEYRRLKQQTLSPTLESLKVLLL